MEYLSKLIYDFSKNKHIANENFIKSIYEILVENYCLNDYIKYIIISNFNNNSLAYYSPEEKIIYVNFQKLIYTVGNTITRTYNTNDYNEQVLCLNLYVLNIILHEIEHARQEKNINNNITEETNILSLSGNYEKILKKLNVYTDVAYYTNPSERQAELVSLKTVLNITNYFNNTNLTNHIEKRLLINTIKNYKISKNKIICPIDLFLNCCNNYFDIFDLLNIINNTEVLSENTDKNLELGLAVPINELKEKRKKLTLL